MTGAFRFDDRGDPLDRPIVLMVAHDGTFDFLAGSPPVGGQGDSHHDP